MNYHNQKRKADTIAAVQLARITAAIMGAGFILKGDFIGAGIMAAVIALLWLALPVTR